MQMLCVVVVWVDLRVQEILGIEGRASIEHTFGGLGSCLKATNVMKLSHVRSSAESHHPCIVLYAIQSPDQSLLSF